MLVDPTRRTGELKCSFSPTHLFGESDWSTSPSGRVGLLVRSNMPVRRAVLLVRSNSPSRRVGLLVRSYSPSRRAGLLVWFNSTLGRVGCASSMPRWRARLIEPYARFVVSTPRIRLSEDSSNLFRIHMKLNFGLIVWILFRIHMKLNFGLIVWILFRTRFVVSTPRIQVTFLQGLSYHLFLLKERHFSWELSDIDPVVTDFDPNRIYHLTWLIGLV